MVKSTDFRFTRPVLGFEVFQKGELIAINAGEEIRSPCDDCTIFMPTRMPVVGREAVSPDRADLSTDRAARNTDAASAGRRPAFPRPTSQVRNQALAHAHHVVHAKAQALVETAHGRVFRRISRLILGQPSSSSLRSAARISAEAWPRRRQSGATAR